MNMKVRSAGGINKVIRGKGILIDLEHRDDGCAEGSEEIVLHFSDGSEISIYRVDDTTWVEGD